MEEADVTKVDKLTTEIMMWMNSAMNQQSKQSLTADPAVKVKDISAKTKVSLQSYIIISILPAHKQEVKVDDNVFHVFVTLLSNKPLD